MVKLLRLGQFWIVRSVTLRQGKLLVPKATDATIFLGACFVISDAAYRIKTIQWFRGPSHEPMQGYAALEGLRLSPAWLAAWVHLCASSLVWPLQLHRLHPTLWHFGFFGVPVLFFATFAPFLAISDGWIDKAQVVYLALERELLAAPAAPLTQSMKDQALLLHSVSSRMYHFKVRFAHIPSVPAALGRSRLLLRRLGTRWRTVDADCAYR